MCHYPFNVKPQSIWAQPYRRFPGKLFASEKSMLSLSIQASPLYPHTTQVLISQPAKQNTHTQKKTNTHTHTQHLEMRVFWAAGQRGAAALLSAWLGPLEGSRHTELSIPPSPSSRWLSYVQMKPKLLPADKKIKKHFILNLCLNLRHVMSLA